MANFIVDDPNCVAFWRFETGNLWVDTKLNNNLNNVNTVVTSTTKKEGGYSADFEYGNSEYMYLPETWMSDSFPMKSTDTAKKISVTAWFRIESLAADRAVCSKYDAAANNRSIIPLRIATGYAFQSVIG